MPSGNNIVKPTHVLLGRGGGNMLSKLSVAVQKYKSTKDPVDNLNQA